jgi:hypothetical protein
MLEMLESRRLLSVVIPQLAPAMTGSAAALGPAISVDGNVVAKGDKIHEFAGIAFTADVGTLANINNAGPNFAYLHGSINWGDGTANTTAIFRRDSTGLVHVIGGHTYKAGGTFNITVSLYELPPSSPGGPIVDPFPLPSIHSTAIVHQNSAGGVTIHETAGNQFTTTVGTFTAIAPLTAQSFHATIDWGDGRLSVGTIKAIGVIGVDVIKFEVLGTHTYTKPGDYAIRIVVTSPPPGPTAQPIRLITTIDSTAIVLAPPVTAV